jgi:hypothetical protein
LDNLEKLMQELNDLKVPGSNEQQASETSGAGETQTVRRKKAPTLVYKRSVSEWSYLFQPWDKLDKENQRYRRIIQIAAAVLGLVFIIILSKNLVDNNRDYRSIKSIEVFHSSAVVANEVPTPAPPVSSTSSLPIHNNQESYMHPRPKAWQHRVVKPTPKTELTEEEKEAQEWIKKENEERLFKLYKIH